MTTLGTEHRLPLLCLDEFTPCGRGAVALELGRRRYRFVLIPEGENPLLR